MDDEGPTIQPDFAKVKVSVTTMDGELLSQSVVRSVYRTTPNAHTNAQMDREVRAAIDSSQHLVIEDQP